MEVVVKACRAQRRSKLQLRRNGEYGRATERERGERRKEGGKRCELTWTCVELLQSSGAFGESIRSGRIR